MQPLDIILQIDPDATVRDYKYYASLTGDQVNFELKAVELKKNSLKFYQNLSKHEGMAAEILENKKS